MRRFSVRPNVSSKGQAAIALEAGKLIHRYKVAKHLALTITDDTFTFTRETARIQAARFLGETSQGYSTVKIGEMGLYPAILAVLTTDARY